MYTLSESLAEYSEAMLRGLAEQWQVQAEDAATLPARLAEALLDRERLATFLARLEPEAQAALAQVAAAGGSLRGHLLTSAYGEARRPGPRAIERDAPWRRPVSATERLWYAGLIFRRYGRLGSYHGELYYIPSDLLAALPLPPAAPATLAPQPVDPPGEAREEGLALALDLELLLARLRLAAVPAGRGDLIAALLGPLSPRWRGSPDPERLALLQRLALRPRLVAKRSDQFQVGPPARSWLQLPPYARQKLLFDTWRGDAHWNELWHVPTLRCEPTGWRNDPLAPRAAVLAALQQCPVGWVRLADLVAALKAGQPDLARPDGDYDSWYIRDEATGQYLHGFAHWDRVEGALIAHLVTRPLYWLGAIALAGPPPAFRLTATGRAFLGLAPEPQAAACSPLVVREDLSILAPPQASAYDRVRLERLARWEGREGENDLYRLDAECTWQALNAGIKAQQIIAFLERAAQHPLPAEAAGRLRQQAAAYGQVTLRRALLMQTATAETLRQIRSDPEVGQRLGATVSERAVLIPEDQLPLVLARLKLLGFWPRLLGLAEP